MIYKTKFKRTLFLNTEVVNKICVKIIKNLLTITIICICFNLICKRHISLNLFQNSLFSNYFSISFIS